ncbi:hypothetical protein D3C78_1558770 [compost metagenome]
MPKQAAERQEESNDFCAQYNRRHTTDRFGTDPDDKCHCESKRQARQSRRNIQRHLCKSMVKNRTTRRNIGVGEDIQHKGNRDAVDHVPALAEQVFGNSVEARPNAIVKVRLKDHQPGMQHAEPGKHQRRQ